jgi:hypothetical protein
MDEAVIHVEPVHPRSRLAETTSTFLPATISMGHVQQQCPSECTAQQNQPMSKSFFAASPVLSSAVPPCISESIPSSTSAYTIQERLQSANLESGPTNIPDKPRKKKAGHNSEEEGAIKAREVVVVSESMETADTAPVTVKLVAEVRTAPEHDPANQLPSPTENRNELKWEKQYQELFKYRDTSGSCLVPRKVWRAFRSVSDCPWLTPLPGVSLCVFFACLTVNSSRSK